MGRPKGSKNKTTATREIKERQECSRDTSGVIVQEGFDQYAYNRRRLDYYEEIFKMAHRIIDREIFETFDMLWERAKRMVDNP